MRRVESINVQGIALTAFANGAHIVIHLDGGRVCQYSSFAGLAKTMRPPSQEESAVMHPLCDELTLLISEPRSRFSLERRLILDM